MQTRGHTMISTSHPGTTPHDTETASDLDFTTGQAGTIGDWTASLAKLLRVAFREIDTDRERTKASMAKASLLLRLQIKRSSFDPAHNRGHLEQDMDVRGQAEEALRAGEERWRTVAPGAAGETRSDRLEIRCRLKYGREVWAEVSTFAVPGAGRLLLCLIAIDITRWEQAEEALGDAQADLAHVARLATTGSGQNMESRCRSAQPSRSPGMAKGFTLCMLEAVIGGRGDEVVNIAKTYLWR
jgi:hypothetical protein